MSPLAAVRGRTRATTASHGGRPTPLSTRPAGLLPALYAQVPFTSVASAEAMHEAEVRFKLTPEADYASSTPAPYMIPGARFVDCMTPAVVPLVLDTVERALAASRVHGGEATATGAAGAEEPSADKVSQSL